MAEQDSLSLNYSQTPVDRFSRDIAQIIYRNDTKYLDVKFLANSVDQDLMGQGTDKVGIWW